MWALNSFFERFVLSFSLKIERFVSDSAEIWICGLYLHCFVQVLRTTNIIHTLTKFSLMLMLLKWN